MLPPETLKLLAAIKPTDWSITKTEAIDFTKPFLWFDDDLFPEEREALLAHNALDSWIEVDLAKNENQLKGLVENFPS